MRLMLQRVKQAAVLVDGAAVAAIDHGLLALVGFGLNDAPAAADSSVPAWKAISAALDKALALRIFPDEEGKMNRSLVDCGGSLLLVSQFTLYADCGKGRRPSFHLSCPPDSAQLLFARFCDTARALLPGKVQSGVFAAMMDVTLTNWGPVTIQLDSADFLK